jgi:hypothetical protein
MEAVAEAEATVVVATGVVATAVADMEEAVEAMVAVDTRILQIAAEGMGGAPPPPAPPPPPARPPGVRADIGTVVPHVAAAAEDLSGEVFSTVRMPLLFIRELPCHGQVLKSSVVCGEHHKLATTQGSPYQRPWAPAITWI